MNNLDAKTNVLITEHSSLREEILLNFNHQQKLYFWIGAVIYAVFVYIIINRINFPEIEILFLFFPLIFFAWLGFNLKTYFKIHQIGCYLELTEKKIDYLLKSSLMKWDKIAGISFREFKNYKKFSSFYIHFFMVLPFLFIFVYSCIGGYNYLKNLEEIKNHLLIANLFVFCVPFFLVGLIFCIIWYYKTNIEFVKTFCEKEFSNFDKIEKGISEGEPKGSQGE